MLTVTNASPAVLSPVYRMSAATDPFDPTEGLRQVLVEPLFRPLVPTMSGVQIDHDGTPMTEDDVRDLALACMADTFDPDAEELMSDLLSQCMLEYYHKSQAPEYNTTRFQELFLNQATHRNHDPNVQLPAQGRVYYDVQGDIVGSSKLFLRDAGQAITAGTHLDDTAADAVLCGIGFVFHPTTLGFYFLNEQAFEDFKSWLATQVSMLSSTLDASCQSLFQQFSQIKLSGLVEGVTLRNDDADNCEPMSFARVLVSMLMSYTGQVGRETFGILPFDMGELLCPRTVTLVNVEAHAHASTSVVKREWGVINQALNMPVRPVSNRKLASLTAQGRAASRALGRAAASTRRNRRAYDAQRAANVRFRKTNLKTMDIVRVVSKVSSKMAQVAKSENSYKSVRMSYARPNRRDPDNFNLQGKVVSTKYRPDIHLYIDTSGSISEDNYEAAVKSCIAMARKMNVNLYFTSFSHVISQTTLLHTRDKSFVGCYREFQRVPKVTGGTDFSLVWDYVNQSKKRRRELSLMLTDFEYMPCNDHIDHPRNLYYLPIANTDWTYLVAEAKRFATAMSVHDAAFRRRLLF